MKPNQKAEDLWKEFLEDQKKPENRKAVGVSRLDYASKSFDHVIMYLNEACGCFREAECEESLKQSLELLTLTEMLRDKISEVYYALNNLD